MLLENLLQNLPEKSYTMHTHGYTEADIHLLQMFNETDQAYSQDTLYYCFKYFDLNTLDSQVHSSFLVCGECIRQGNTRELGQVNIIVAADDMSPEILFNRIQEILYTQDRIQAQMNQMTQVCLKNRGLNWLLSEGYKFFNNPMILELPGRRRITMFMGNDLGNAKNPLREFVNEEPSLNYLTEDGTPYFQKIKLAEKILDSGKPELFFHDRIGKDIMAFPVRVFDVNLATIFIVASNRPFQDSDYELIRHFSLLVGQEIQKEPFHPRNRGSYINFLLIDLLKSKYIDLESVNYDLRRIDYKLKGKYQIAVLHSNSFPCPDFVPSRIQGILTGHLYAFYEDDLVIMFNLYQNEKLNDSTREKMRKFSRSNNMCFGISNENGSIIYLRDVYQQAKTSAELGDSSLKAPLVDYKYVAYIDMLNTCKDGRTLFDFADPDLVLMIENEYKKSQTWMAETLYKYIQCACSTSETARSLNIHKNTLLYRLAKLRECLENKLENGDDIFRYHLTFKILAIQKMFGVQTYAGEVVHEKAGCKPPLFHGNDS
jgi:hypothetical protein